MVKGSLLCRGKLCVTKDVVTQSLLQDTRVQFSSFGEGPPGGGRKPHGKARPVSRLPRMSAI